MLPSCPASSVEPGAHRLEHGAEHVRRQPTGVRVLARAVIAVENREIADRVDGAVAERGRRRTPAERDDDAVMGDGAERDDGGEVGNVREVLLEKPTAVRD